MDKVKRMKNIEKEYDKTKRYSLSEAVELLKRVKKTNFDESVDISINLNVDPKKADQNVRSTIVLPFGIGKSQKICVIAKGEKLKDAESSGADYFGQEEMIEKISKGWLDFDILIATPDIMKELSKLGKILGPKKLMPNPKAGTVTFEISKAVAEFKKGKVEYRVDSNGIIHNSVGKISFDMEKLVANAQSLIDAITKMRPASVKGQYIKNISLSTTMGPGIKIVLQ